MDDFTIEVKNLPFDVEFESNEDALKACFYQHFEELIKREVEMEKEEEREEG